MISKTTTQGGEKCVVSGDYCVMIMNECLRLLTKVSKRRVFTYLSVRVCVCVCVGAG